MKPEGKIEELKKDLLPEPQNADLSDLANFEYPNDLPQSSL